MALINRFLKNPKAYLKQLKFYAAGVYFNLFEGEFKTDSCTFEIPKQQVNTVGRGYFTLGLYERDERAHIHKIVKGGDTVLELGGCIGVISCITNKLLQNRNAHVVVEANAELIPFLTRNRDKNGCGFSIENAIVSNEEYVDFYIGNSFVASGTYQSDSNNRKVRLPGITPEQLENKYKLKFDTLVMDIEGGEYDFILGNTSFVGGLKKIFMEEHQFILKQEKFNHYENVLRDRGFVKESLQDNICCWTKIDNNHN